MEEYLHKFGCFSKNISMDKDDEAFCITAVKQMFHVCKKEKLSLNCLAEVREILNNHKG